MMGIVKLSTTIGETAGDRYVDWDIDVSKCAGIE